MRMESKGLWLFRRAPLAAQLVSMFALADASASLAATTWTVSSCSNEGAGTGQTGTLRFAMNNAVAGDTVDMTALVCSTIDLAESGTTPAALPIRYSASSSPITVLGPGRYKLSIQGDNAVRIFSNTAPTPEGFPPNLIVEDLTLSSGYAPLSSASFGDGGCILNTGSVTLRRVTVTTCNSYGKGGAIRADDVTLDHAMVQAGAAFGGGGGIFAATVTMTSSVVSHNGAAGSGGGVYGISVSLTDSTVTYNSAGNITTSVHGGGIYAGGNLTITGSTISHNLVYGNQGGIHAFSKLPSSVTTTITNSTISNNYARFAEAGIYVNSGHTKFYNSTIAFNYAKHDSTVFSAGVATSSVYGDLDLTFYSTLISNNFGGATEHDFSLSPGIGHTVTQHGSHNFARTTDYSPNVFSFQGQCPLLGPLRDNGGPTKTHALIVGSPAINAGDNVLSLPYDQRGPPYLRVAKGTADIGAYEVPADVVFNSGFEEGC